ncbi:uncharacterized protein LOC111436933 [Cucurbita moschata]|uniref:Uncharacterized protein LOC111436933 n=1 Tax=Cucurbita moschata TaxID=3662 RepID=A0A6J1ERK1_CUCMO|nr:uncharacterized protein LOC111436933 [Cucurbita moschata]XP_022930495.1 uncharacterized protein LOC111436933 [Cucurbita moschata]
MGVEKDGSQNGGSYGGGFFHLFDWTAKSRKRLFSSKPDVQERSKQGNRSAGNSPLTQAHLIGLDECGTGRSIKGSSDYSCSSSVTEDEGCGVKVPGVVARLMGLDSLPSSHFSDTYFTPSFDTQSLQEAPSDRGSFNYRHDCPIMFSGNLLDPVDDRAAASSRKPSETKPHKIISRPIEKFQTEILPPKSAKSIPITHHKLLSPIKSPAFIPTKNAAHIMEAAARIIDSVPPATTKSKISSIGSSSAAPLKLQAPKEKIDISQKMPLVRSSSVSLKAKELKEKAESSHKSARFLETSRKPLESNASRLLKGQSMNKSWDGSQDSSSFKVLPDAEYSSSKNKGKSISLAIQAKVNVQRRENVNTHSHRNFTGQKQQNEGKSSQPLKTQTSSQKNLHVQSSVCNASNNHPLKQNNQRQNCHVDRVKLPSKKPISNTEGKKSLNENFSFRHRRNAGRVVVGSKAGARKTGLDISDRERVDLHSNAKNLPRKKRSIDRDQRFDKKQARDDMLTDKIQMSIHSNSNNIADSSSSSLAQDCRKKGTDIVSFTFTAPLTRKVPGSDTYGHIDSKLRGPHGSDSLKSSSIECNIIGENALSALLEQKLRELIDKVESSSPSIESITRGSESSCLSTSDHLSPSLDTLDTLSTKLNETIQQSSVCSKQSGLYSFDYSSTDSSLQGLKQEFPLVHRIEECSSNSIDADAEQLLKVRHPSPVSILEHSFSSESCDSSDSNSREGNKFCSSIQGQDVIEADAELLDSASSLTNEAPTSKFSSSISKCSTGRTVWELEYIKDILCDVELMFNDYVLGRSREVINPYLFNILENQNKGSEQRVRRKALFDCVCECLDLRCRQYVGGGYKMWGKGLGVLGRKEQLGKEIWKEISEWSGMGDCMVDELVDNDMSCWHGRWLDFEVDAFTIGVELESQILDSLVEEVLGDIAIP